MAENHLKVISIIMVLLPVMIFATPITAQTSQGLQWNISIGEQTFFHYYYWADHLHDENEDVYFNVTGSIGDIPNPLDDWWNIPDVAVEVKYLNGTEFSPGYPSPIDYILFLTWKTAVPIGNWSLLTELVENVSEFDYTYTNHSTTPSVTVDNWYQWGFTYTWSDSFDYVVHVSYLKTDGSLVSSRILGYETGTFTLIGEASIIRDGVLPIVNNPADITYSEGRNGNEIVWNANDTSPAAYTILRDYVEIKKGLWNSTSENIAISVDGLSQGSYEYQVTFIEASGKSSSDRVVVEVTEPQSITSPYLLIITGIGCIGVGVILMIVYFIKKKKGP